MSLMGVYTGALMASVESESMTSRLILFFWTSFLISSMVLVVSSWMGTCMSVSAPFFSKGARSSPMSFAWFLMSSRLCSSVMYMDFSLNFDAPLNAYSRAKSVFPVPGVPMTMVTERSGSPPWTSLSKPLIPVATRLVT